LILIKKQSEENIMNEFNKKVETLENEMDIRVESLIAEIHNYRDDYRLRLNNSKTEFQK
jgi:hypothetical protein